MVEVLVEMKVCTKCGVDKGLGKFSAKKDSKYGVHCYCNACVKVYNKSYRKVNKDKIKALARIYTDANKEKSKAYYEANKDKSKAYYEANKDEIKARMNAYGEANKDKIKAYRDANKNKIKARRKAFYEANEDKINARRKSYREANKDKIKAGNRAYRDVNKNKTKVYHKAYREANKDKIRAKAILWEKTKKGASIIKAQRQKRRLAKQYPQTKNALTKEDWQTVLKEYGYICVYCQKDLKSPTLDHVIPLSKGGPHEITNVVPACLSCNCSKGPSILWQEWTPKNPSEKLINNFRKVM